MGKKKRQQGGNAVIYARYSSHNQKDVSIEQQYDACVKFAAANGYQIVERYADRAVSGRTDNRPQFQRMMKDAHKGEFDFVIAWKSNRMGRNMMQAMVNESKLADLGIRCLYVEEDFDDTAAGRFALRNMMNVNQFYSENMAEDVLRGMADNASKCKVNNLPPYGYRKGKDGRFEINEEQAAVVREIFSRVLSGWSIYDIQTDLNRRGIRTGRGTEWKKQSFGHLLQNDKYIGVYRWADVVVEDGMPAILDRDTFDRVQAVLKSKKKPRGKQRMNDDYILSGRLYCGKCGAPMTAQAGTSKTGRKFNYYCCNRKRYDHTCDKKSVPQEKIESAVTGFIKEELLRDDLIEWIVSGYKATAENIRDDTRKKALQAELDDVNTRLANILRAIEAGIFNETTQERMQELTSARKDLEQAVRLEELSNRLPAPDEVRFWLYELRSGDLDDRLYQRRLITTFVRAVFVYDDRLRIQFNYGTESNFPTDSDPGPGGEFATGPDWSTKTPELCSSQIRGFSCFSVCSAGFPFTCSTTLLIPAGLSHSSTISSPAGRISRPGTSKSSARSGSNREPGAMW